MSGTVAYLGARLFDGEALHDGRALLVAGGRVAGIVADGDLPPGAAVETLPGGVLAPGFVDLQVNGGGGVLVNETPTPEGLAAVAEAHARLGALAILPTLVTDRPEVTRAAIAAAAEAAARGVPGIAGLHLEGPHLAVARKGAHDPGLIRPMDDADQAMLTDARRRLPVLMVTLAPETVPPERIAALAAAGIVVSLGHSDCDFETAQAAEAAGAACVTHLFNAMSPLGHRAPGLVGAALASERLAAGLIADGLHVHPAAMGVALRAARGPVFLVSDAMSPAGTTLDHFFLNGRRIERRDGRLTLADGTLAGADLDLARAVRVLVGAVGWPLAAALAMATSVPAGVIGAGDRLGRLAPGRAADMVWLDAGLALGRVWRGGMPLAL
jgi:N-acetylglucosamine-6-phosphate deacetylase